jgi:aconitase B
MYKIITSLITPPFYEDNVELWINPGVLSRHMAVGICFREGGGCHCPPLNTVAINVVTVIVGGDAKTRKPLHLNF